MYARPAARDDSGADMPRDLSATDAFNISSTRDCSGSYIPSGKSDAPRTFETFLSITDSGSAICFILSWLRLPMMSIFFIMECNGMECASGSVAE